MTARSRKAQPNRYFNPPFTRGEAASIDRAARLLGISGYRFVAVAAVEMARRVVGSDRAARPKG